MKKIAIFSVLGVLFGASVAMGAMKVQEIKSWDYIAQIVSTSAAQGNIFIYKVADGDNTCYIMTNDYTINARANGANLGISCVNSVVKK